MVYNKKILITGSNGLVGQYLLKALAGSGAIVMATGKGPLRVPELISAGMEYRELSARWVRTRRFAVLQYAAGLGIRKYDGVSAL